MPEGNRYYFFDNNRTIVKTSTFLKSRCRKRAIAFLNPTHISFKTFKRSSAAMQDASAKRLQVAGTRILVTGGAGFIGSHSKLAFWSELGRRLAGVKSRVKLLLPR